MHLGGFTLISFIKSSVDSGDKQADVFVYWGDQTRWIEWRENEMELHCITAHLWMHHLCAVHCISSQSGRTGTQLAAQSVLRWSSLWWEGMDQDPRSRCNWSWPQLPAELLRPAFISISLSQCQPANISIVLYLNHFSAEYREWSLKLFWMFPFITALCSSLIFGSKVLMCIFLWMPPAVMLWMSEAQIF